MRLAAGYFFLAAAAWANSCAPTPVLPLPGSYTGRLADSLCSVPLGAAYAEHRLILPARGSIDLRVSAGRMVLRDRDGRKLGEGAALQLPLEAGEHFVLVFDAQTYRIDTGWAREEGAICRTFPLIGTGEPAVATPPETGCRLPDGTPFIGYDVAPLSPGTLRVETGGLGYLTVRNAAGAALGIAAEDGSIAVAVDGGERYTIVAAGTAEHRVTATLAVDAQEPCRAGKALVSGENVAAKLTAECRAESPYQFYPVEISETGSAEIRVSSPAFEPEAVLLDARGYAIDADTQTGGQGIALLRRQLPKGVYTLRIAGNREGDYEIRYTFRPGLESCPVLTLPPVAENGGVLNSASCRGAAGPEDIYRLEVPADGAVDIRMTSTELNPLLALRDAAGNLLSFGADPETGEGARILADLPKGEYLLTATGGGLPGRYTLVWNHSTKALAPCAQRTPLPPNSAYLGLIGDATCRDAEGPRDTYSFNLSRPGTIAAVMQALDLDSRLVIHDNQGTPLRADEDGFGLRNAIVTQHLPAGDYRLVARSSRSGQLGYYRVDLLHTPGDRPAACSPARTLAVGEELTAALSYTGCEYGDGTFADLYWLEIKEAVQVEIGARSSFFDVALELLDSRGNLLDRDDDGAGGTNAALLETLEPGTYVLVVKPSLLTSTGGYALSVLPVRPPSQP